jgi:hypothetical protein
MALCKHEHVARVVLDEAQLLSRVSTVLSPSSPGLHIFSSMMVHPLLGFVVTLNLDV